MSRITLSILFVLLLAVNLSAGLDPSYSPQAVIDTVPLYAEADYDPAIPHPDQYLQYPLGQWPLRYHELVDFLEAVDAASDRISITTYGQTFEGRDLYAVVISSEANMARVDEIRESVARLADPESDLSTAAVDQMVEDLPATAWLGYSIHGDEVSGVDAAAYLIYHFAAGNDPATLELLDNIVMVVDPTQNPDGRERYLSMLQTHKSAVPNYNRFSMQHQGVWPWGRTNHYLFDLNRDWILLRQAETRGKLATINKWHPQLVVDAHEMGSNATYLFSPPREPVNYNTPKHFWNWIDDFRDDQAAAFDERGWPYYTGEWDDQWYPGYGGAWPCFTGSIGILYEMAGVDGQFVKQRDDYLLTYHEAINKQFTSSLTNLTTLAKHRVDIMKEYREARKKIVRQGRGSRLAFLVEPDRDEIKMKRFVDLLLDQGIKVERATASFTATRLTDIFGDSHNSREFPAGTYIVSTAQAHGALAKAAMEFDPRLKLEFLETERQELEKNNDTRMYEVSAWSVPLAFNLTAFETRATLNAQTEPVTEFVLSEGQLVNPNAKFGYVVEMAGEKTYLLLTKLFEQDFVVYCSAKPFTLEGHNYGSGSLVIRKRGNPPDLAERLNLLAGEIDINIYGVNTGLSEHGSLLGAPTFRLLRKPRIGIIAGNGTDYTGFGTAWYLLDQELKVPHSLINLADFGEANLDLYNVIIFSPTWGPLNSKIGKSGAAKIKKWVENGGTLVGFGETAVWAADSSRGISKLRLKRQALDKLDEYDIHLTREKRAWTGPEVDTMALWYPEKVSVEATVDEDRGKKLSGKALEDQDRWERRFRPRGAILRAELDLSDFLTFGMKPTLPVQLYTRYAFLSKPPVKTVARFADPNELRMSGLLWPEARQRWANTAWASRERLGKGQLILFATNPNIRAYFYGSRQMLVNALLLGPGFGSSFEGPYE